ncbi:MAG: hypothetical protein DRI01_10530 [Chloroflexi bacterium]|nr:MAG: hypothetical protein DRI01_10530 [Chloroflexota bacterium]
MKNKGIGWVLVAVMIVTVVILAVVAIVCYSRMWETAANIDFLSAVSSYFVFLIAGIAAVVIGIILILLLKG